MTYNISNYHSAKALVIYEDYIGNITFLSLFPNSDNPASTSDRDILKLG